jgi:transcriptional regulator with XRE-family HTH domain
VQKGGSHLKVQLKALRVNKNMSQDEAAAALKVTTRTIQNWESYKTFPTAQQLLDICSIYDCELGDIFLPSKLAESE